MHLRETVMASQLAKEHGNTPFGAVLAGPSGETLMTQENIEITTGKCTGHAETTLAERASVAYNKSFLWQCTLYSSVEPCVMCSGAIYWANIGRVAFGATEMQLLAITGENEQNPTCSLPCGEVFACTPKNIEVVGPFPELEAEILCVHSGYWN